MSIKNILVSFNGTDGAARAVRLAAAMARRYDAHLTGVFAHTAPHTRYQFEAYLTQAALYIMDEGVREAEEQRREEFEEIVGSAEQGVRNDFICQSGFPNDVLSRMGRTYDLIVMAQPDGKSSVYDEPRPDDVAMESGRPVLVAPRGFERFEQSAAAVLAWDGERAASRALADAMDLLEDKHRLMVLHVGSDEKVRQPGASIMEHLSRHGLEATLNVEKPGGLSTSEIILNACAETDAGLLVMGAYEHSRVSEMLLGGVTRDVVARSHIPVLMSH
ncbi:MAG: universal stress protein [Pseudomonadota bacterium]